VKRLLEALARSMAARDECVRKIESLVKVAEQ
jgi:hypothetical protein